MSDNIHPSQLNVIDRLRRLRAQLTPDLPAAVAHKAQDAFTLNEDPRPSEALSEVQVMVFPQDPFAGEPEVRHMAAEDISPGLINTRFRVQDSAFPSAQPDSSGYYLYEPGTPEFTQVNCFYYATLTLRMYERYARRTIPWPFSADHLLIDPHAGTGANAFYNESDTMLGFLSFQTNGTTIHMAQSADVITHETAHAVLDGLRDLWNESFGLGPTAFHESFGDITAVLIALHDDSLVARLIRWTGGNLQLDNFIASVAEYTSEPDPTTGQPVQSSAVYLRNALNKFTYLPFDSLPYTPTSPETTLGRECHNYSRLFTGTFYDLLVGIYDHMKRGMSDRVAIHRTRGILGRLLVFAIELAPVGECSFADLARAFLTAEHIEHHGTYRDILIRTFAQRAILTEDQSRAHINTLSHLPLLLLPDNINSAADSAGFFTEFVVPALNIPTEIELTPYTAHRNTLNESFLTYYTRRRIYLNGPQFGQFNGAAVDLFGGLSLMFDATRTLRSACLRLIEDEDVRQIKILVAEMTRDGRIATGETLTPIQNDNLGFWSPNLPVAMHDTSPVGSSRIIKLPMIIDSLPRHLSSLTDYLQLWRES